MKPLKVAIASFCMLGSALSWGAEATNYTPDSRTYMETFTSKVIKVYSFQENDLDYVAYVVNWKDYEVIVTPLGLVAGEKRYNVGDTIHCTMQQTRMGSSMVGHPRISFFLASPLDDRQRTADALAAKRKQRSIDQAGESTVPHLTPGPTPTAGR